MAAATAQGVGGSRDRTRDSWMARLDLAESAWLPVTALIVVHVPIGIFTDLYVPYFATAHAVLALAVVGWVAARTHRAEAIAACAAYVAGAEVLWRMGGARVPWEVGKYATAALFVVGVIRLTRQRPRWTGLPLAYLLILAPAAIVTLERFGLRGGWERISFNVLAHVALAAAVVFFANFTIERLAMTTLLWTLLAPIVAVSAIATRSTAALSAADFNEKVANIATTAGYGPNQVSAVLGLGVLACAFLVMFESRRTLQVVAVVVGLWLMIQGALTFSRGGSFNVVVALAVASPFVLSRARYIFRFLGAAAVLALLTVTVLIPVGEAFTGGTISARFTSASTTLRTDLAAEELSEFVDHPGFGTGVGMAERADPFDEVSVASHTEFTRLLAEHGLLGLAAMGLLVAMGVQAVRRQASLLGRIMAAACIGWVLAEMSHSATRLAAVAFVFGLAHVVVKPLPEAQPVPRAGSITRPVLRASTRSA